MPKFTFTAKKIEAADKNKIINSDANFSYNSDYIFIHYIYLNRYYI